MIRREDRDGIAVLHLEHGKVNAIDLELFDALHQQLYHLETDHEIRAIVLTGNGRSFSAGVDLFRVLDGGESYTREFLESLDRTLKSIFLGPVPVVAAVDGHAIAGGCILAAACDRRLVAEGTAKLGVTELLVGVPFPHVALAVLRALLPAHHLYDLVTTGRLVGPAEALKIGLVDEVVPADELLDRAVTRAKAFAEVPKPVWGLTKQQLRKRALWEPGEDAEVFGTNVSHMWDNPRILERIRSFLDKTVGKK